MTNAPRKVLVRGLYGWAIGDCLLTAFTACKRNAGSPANIKAGAACLEVFDVPEGTSCNGMGALTFPTEKGAPPRRLGFLDKNGKLAAAPEGFSD